MSDAPIYRGKAMQWPLRNIHEDYLLDDLRLGRQVFAMLEPGDATRYELLITWCTAPHLGQAFNLGDAAKDALLVVRTVNGSICGACLYGWMAHGSVMHISNGIDWSAKLLSWWLDGLLARLNAEVPAL
jgi:hypothetical protein